MTRPSWDSFFIDLAKLWSEMSTCSRRQVGAVVVQYRKVVGNGFNGVASGRRHCTDGGCPRGALSSEECAPGSDYNQFPCRALHAEHNAILQAGLDACAGATLYVTDEPCQQCTNLIEHAKIARVVVTPRKTGETLSPERVVVMGKPNPEPYPAPPPLPKPGDNPWKGPKP